MNTFTKNALLGLAAAACAGLATVALPLFDYVLNQRGKEAAKPRIVAQVSVKSLEPPKPEARPRRAVQKPQRAKPAPTMAKAGPRFAMDLGVMGSGGVAAPIDIINKRSGGSGAAAGDDGVDDRPQPSSPPPFRMPPEVKNKEIDAYLLLSFCVDATGKPYDIKVAQEKPPGLGMAAAGREALQQTRFTPARKGNTPVAFCGLEQPFEIRFSN
jgi:hypothetical protein